MPLWGRKPAPKAITASGRYVDLNDRQTVADLAMTRMAWQAMAWNYRNQIGELGQALRMKGQIISKVQFMAAAVDSGSDEPKVLTGEPDEDKDEDGHPWVPDRVAKAAVDCASRLPWEQGYEFIGRMSQGFDVAGECWLHGFKDADGEDVWKIRSTSEISPNGAGGMSVIDLPGRAARVIPPDSDETLIRLWVPHPEFGQLADSPLRSLLDVCEDVVMCSREVRAATLSRIASNGLLLVPNGVTMVKGTETVTPEQNRFMADFTTAMTAPIANEAHPSAVAPILFQGEAEDLHEIRHVTLTRDTDATVLERQTKCLDRIADSIDLPAEAMRGIGDANHWTAWLIDAQSFKNHLEPGCRLIVDSLTDAWFRRLLMMPVSDGGYGLSKDEARMVRLWYRAGNITENANRSGDADTAMDRGAISFKSYRVAKGFGEDDAPNEDDLRQIQLIKSVRLDPITMSQLAAQLLGTKEVIPATDRILDADGNPITQPQVIQGQTVPPGQVNGPAPVQPGQTAPGGPAATAPAGARVASAASAQGVLDSVKIITADQLADLDKALIERIRQAAESDLVRALEKAGNKVKAQAQGKRYQVLAAELADWGGPADQVCAHLGQTRVHELGLTEDVLLTLAFSYLAGKFTEWTTGAVKASVKTLATMIPIPLTVVAQLTQTMTDRIPAAWKKLEGSLRDRATKAMYGRHGDELRGEVPDTIVLPGDIRTALAEIGGHHDGAGGIAVGGDILRTLDSHADRVGFTWRYGITPRQNTFEPHYRVAGESFTGFDDPALTPPGGYEWVGPHMKPGDHPGCMCDSVYAWALADADAVALADLESNAGHTDRVLAAIDDAAGRTGTHSQRTRDERDRIMEVQRAWIERRAPR
jgi:hypothetical protein